MTDGIWCCVRAVGMAGPPAGLSWMSHSLADRLSNTTASDTELTPAGGRPGSRSSQRRDAAGSPGLVGLPPPAYPGSPGLPPAYPGVGGGLQRELPGLPGRELHRAGHLRREPALGGDPLHHRSTPPVIGE